jgi:two-component system, response regulator PdtaR
LPPVNDLPPNALIVVVDDDVLARMGASDMFSSAGYQVLEAGSAVEALRLFETKADIRVLFTDVSMAGAMDGSDLARRVAELWPSIGIIMTSGLARPLRLPPTMLFHEKPYFPASVLRQAKEMTSNLH